MPNNIPRLRSMTVTHKVIIHQEYITMLTDLIVLLDTSEINVNKKIFFRFFETAIF